MVSPENRPHIFSFFTRHLFLLQFLKLLPLTYSKIDMTCVDFDLAESVNLQSDKALVRAVLVLLQNGREN